MPIVEPRLSERPNWEFVFRPEFVRSARCERSINLRLHSDKMKASLPYRSEFTRFQFVRFLFRSAGLSSSEESWCSHYEYLFCFDSISQVFLLRFILFVRLRRAISIRCGLSFSFRKQWTASEHSYSAES